MAQKKQLNFYRNATDIELLDVNQNSVATILALAGKTLVTGVYQTFRVYSMQGNVG